jgi:hypothetical protein
LWRDYRARRFCASGVVKRRVSRICWLLLRISRHAFAGCFEIAYHMWWFDSQLRMVVGLIAGMQRWSVEALFSDLVLPKKIIRFRCGMLHRRDNWQQSLSLQTLPNIKWGKIWHMLC